VSDYIIKLREYFERFPGIGPRQARRFVYWLLSEEFEFIKNFGETLLELKKNAKQCDRCFRFFINSHCELCRNINRDNSLLLVVERDIDLENIEKSGMYSGRYFVLGGIVPFSEPPKIRLKELFERLQKDAKDKILKEVILAFSATAEGDNTCRYIEKILEPITQKYSLKISRFGRGISTGADLEYLDRDTLKNALENRK
jgi:recombination protein RecR